MKLLLTDEAFDLDTVWMPFHLITGNKNPGGNLYITAKDYERFEQNYLYITAKDYERFEQNCVKGRKTIFCKGINESVLKEIHQRRREYYRNKIK